MSLNVVPFSDERNNKNKLELCNCLQIISSYFLHSLKATMKPQVSSNPQMSLLQDP